MDASTLAGFRRSIQAAAGDADARMLRIGDGLTGALATLGSLTRTFEALPQELESEAVQAAGRTLANAAAELRQMAQALTEERAAMQRLAGYHRGVGASIDALRKTIGAITILAVNAQITAAHIDGSGEELFAFTAEIAQLATTAARTISGYETLHADLRRQLDLASSVLDAFSRCHGDTLVQVAGQIGASREAVERRQSQSAAAAAEIGRRSQRMSADVGALVMALQVGDMTRQRLEHVDFALGVLQARADGGLAAGAEPGSWWSGLTPGQADAVAGKVCELQAAQVHGAIGDFDEETARIAGALATLGEDAERLVRFGIDTYGAAERGGGSFLAELDIQLRDAARLIEQYRAARGEIEQTIATAGTMLAQFLERLSSVRRIEVDMRLVGLNTTFKCGRLGTKGRTLAVIAQELRAYANLTVEAANGLGLALREVIAAAEALRQGGGAEQAARLDALSEGMRAGLAALRGAGTRLDGALAALDGDGDRVSVVLMELAGLTRNSREAMAEIRQVEGALAGLAASLPQDADLGPILAERLRHFGGDRYTMASEREIEAGMARSGSGPAVPAQSAEAALNDLLF